MNKSDLKVSDFKPNFEDNYKTGTLFVDISSNV